MAMIKLSSIKPNPNNPRVIKDDKFKKLVKSIKDFPKMMELRPMVVNSGGIVLGGNMRLKALKELGYKEIPKEWVKSADELTEDEQRQFIIKDNIGFGEHDWEILRAEWDLTELEEWGLDIVKAQEEVDVKDLFDIEIPFYTPSEHKPEVSDLADVSTTKSLISDIDKLNIDEDLKELLRIRAGFFTDFNFDKIADFYYNSSEDVKAVFKKLGMVILAPKEAVEHGFVELQENIWDV